MTGNHVLFEVFHPTSLHPLTRRDSSLGEGRGYFSCSNAERVFMSMTVIISFRRTHSPLRSFRKLKKNGETDTSDTTKFTHCSASCGIGQLWLCSEMLGVASDLFISLVFNNAVLQRHASSNKTKTELVLARK